MEMANEKPLKELITELRSLLADVQPGEWTTAPNHGHSARPRSLGISNGSREVLRHGAMRYSDAALTVATHNALPRLLDALEQVERERDQLLAHGRRVESDVGALAPRFGGPAEADQRRKHH
jgi:hypothetical protein